jgi:hypothetical protein
MRRRQRICKRKHFNYRGVVWLPRCRSVEDGVGAETALQFLHEAIISQLVSSVNQSRLIERLIAVKGGMAAYSSSRFITSFIG